MNKGALAILRVNGPEDKAVYSGKEVDSVYLGDKSQSLAVVSQAQTSSEHGTLSLDVGAPSRLAGKFNAIPGR